MALHRKKRVEIILEAPAVNRLTAALEAVGVTGYTLLPVLGGKGRTGTWSRDGLVGGAGQMVMVITIVDPARIETLCEQVMRLLSKQIGLMTIGDVEVIRGDRF